MKSKATAYRERAVRGCFLQACKVTCRSPIRYLRRAAELAGNAPALLDPSGTVLGLPGLTTDLVDYVLTHPSSIYDFQALSLFASSLLSSGYSDLAAGVYSKLLQFGGDSGQQVEALRGLLACWGGSELEDEQRLVEKLAALSCREGPEGCRPARFVGVLLAAGLPDEVVLHFCEHILGSATSGLGGAGSSGKAGHCSSSEKQQQLAGPSGESQGSGASVTAGSSAYADLLYVYTKLRCGRLDAALASRYGSKRSSPAGTSSREELTRMAVGTEAEGSGSPKAQVAGKRIVLHHLRRRPVQRALCSAVYALVVLTGSTKPLARVLKVASMLVLLNPLKQTA